MRIALDAMGGDYAPQVVVEAAFATARQTPLQIILIGPSDILAPLLKKHGDAPSNLVVHHAPQVVGMGEHPSTALRQKPDSSIAQGMQLVKSGQADGFVSAGNTGAVMAFALHLLGRLPNIDRPALGTVFPTGRGPCLLLDVGANADCKPGYLLQFAHMGSAYMRGAFGVPQPTVGLLNIGEEEGKGNQLAQAAYRLLQDSGLPFAGNVEAHRLPEGVADVVVTDGFSGNMVIKTAEGVSDLVIDSLREAIISRLSYRIAGALLRPALRAIAAKLDYSEQGGAPLLGVRGLVIIGHGRSNAHAIQRAIAVAQQAAEGKVVEHIDALTLQPAETEAE